MRRTIPILFLAAQWIAAVPSPAKSGTRTESARIEAQVRALGERIRKAVLARDVEALIALMNPEGLECGDGLSPLDDVRRDLNRRGTFMNSWFFDSRELEKGWTGKMEMHPSLLEFFRRAKDLRVETGFSSDETGQPWLERPSVRWRASNIAWIPAFGLWQSGGRVWILEDPWCE